MMLAGIPCFFAQVALIQSISYPRSRQKALLFRLQTLITLQTSPI